MKSNGKPYTLSIDVGGTGLKASVLDAKGRMRVDRVRMETPYPCPPKVLLEALSGLVKPLPPFDRVSVGFPGVVRGGRVLTAPHFGNDVWEGFRLARALEKSWGKPVRVLNDADMQGLAVIRGRGLELVVTLGTGVGTALFKEGRLMQRMELAQHPAWHDKTYNEYIGDKVLKRKGRRKWNKRVKHALGLLRTLLNPDKVYFGGGNSRNVDFKLDKDTRIVSNAAGVLGGIALWGQDYENI